MAKGRGGSRQRMQESKALVSKAAAERAVVLANSPRAVRDAIEESAADKVKSEKAKEREKTRYEKFLSANRQYLSSETQIEVIGGVAGQGWNESMSMLMRYFGELSQAKSGDEGFWAKNVDLLQSVPGAIAGVVYVLEKAMRPDTDPEDDKLPPEQRRPYVAGDFRRTVSEAAKVAAHLGFSNTVRALRFRWAESIDEKLEKSEAVKQYKQLLQQATDELAEARAQLKAIARGKNTGSSSGNNGGSGGGTNNGVNGGGAGNGSRGQGGS